MELNAAFQIGSQACQTIDPAMESRLKFSPAGHSHLNAANGVERLSEAGNDNLSVQSGEQAFSKDAPEGIFLVFRFMKSDDDFASVIFLKGVHDAVGNIRCNTALRLHPYIGS